MRYIELITTQFIKHKLLATNVSSFYIKSSTLQMKEYAKTIVKPRLPRDMTEKEDHASTESYKELEADVRFKLKFHYL